MAHANLINNYFNPNSVYTEEDFSGHFWIRHHVKVSKQKSARVNGITPISHVMVEHKNNIVIRVRVIPLKITIS